MLDQQPATGGQRPGGLGDDGADVGQAVGARDETRARRTAMAGLWLACGLSVLMVAMFAPQFQQAIQAAPAEEVAQAIRQFGIYLSAAAAMIAAASSQAAPRKRCLSASP